MTSSRYRAWLAPVLGATVLGATVLGATVLAGCGRGADPVPSQASTAAPTSASTPPFAIATPSRFPGLPVDAADPCLMLTADQQEQLMITVPAGTVSGTGPGQLCAYVSRTDPTTTVVTVAFDGGVSLPQWAAERGASYPPVRATDYPTVVTGSASGCLAGVAVTADQVVSVQRAATPGEIDENCDGAQTLLLAVLDSVRRLG